LPTCDAYFAEKNSIKRDEIAARQAWLLQQHWTGKLRSIDVKDMFVQMRDQIRKRPSTEAT
jgi:hypothetical protein